MIGNPTSMNQNMRVSDALICDVPSLLESHALSRLGSTVAPGTHKVNVDVVHGSCGGGGLRVATSDDSQEMCQALCTRKPWRKR